MNNLTSNNKKFGDIDIDFSDRTLALSVLNHTPASILRNTKLEKHNTGVYFHLVPIDPITNLSSINYEDAENLGWFKIDLLNVGIYEKIKDEEHLINLMNSELDWKLFEYHDFTEKLIHLGNYSKLVSELKPKCVEHIAMILALIRPGKKHLMDKCKHHGFESIKDDIWLITDGDGYVFKKAHATSYAILVYVHANLLIEESQLTYQS